MDNFPQNRLERTIDALSKIASFFHDKKQELLDKYLKMDEKAIVDDLLKNIYNVIGKDSEYYDYALDIIRNYNISFYSTIEEMKKYLDDNFNDKKDKKIDLEKILNILNNFNKYGIDYYITGVLACYLKCDILLSDINNIEIMINENDIEKVKHILKTNNFKFYDDRFITFEKISNKEKLDLSYPVFASSNNLSIGFLIFKRERDNSITTREYFHKIENDKVIVDVKEKLLSTLGTILRYDEIPISYDGINIKTTTIENIYKLMNNNSKLEPYIDKNKLSLLEEHKSIDITIKNVVLNENNLSKYK